MPPPKEVSELVERFERNFEAYKAPVYKEDQLRIEFINPFFESLGWDVSNKKGYAEVYKEVVHEDAVKIGSATKAPDYCFRLSGVRKFFVEAKKPSVNIKDDAPPSFQLRRYAWSAKLPLSILTDFEEFAVYDCRVKPSKADKSTMGRIKYITYKEYPEKWDELASIFSPEAILKGSFDKYAEAGKSKRGTAAVDDAFLDDIENWRDMLARNIAIRNPKLSQRELNFSVQRTIDRVIFLRICEDRGVENYGRLMGLLNGSRVYARMSEIFRRADERYNSGLFHFGKEKDRKELPDEMTLELRIDDEPLQKIIRSLYYPDSPYEFSVLPADILGQVYEQFLGKVIRLTAGHQAKVEEKPEVKKAGGVYYTPTYIVDYIVKNTVGKLLGSSEQAGSSDPAVLARFENRASSMLSREDPLSRQRRDQTLREQGGTEVPPRQVTPKQVSKLRILDPACGSGSFLIGAYQYLLDWHRDWYVKDGAEKWSTAKNPTLYNGRGGDWCLTTDERKRILLNNIYGVDIDSQAVEVTKLSLLLKVLEGENEQTIQRQLVMFHQRALPDLGENIKCGNSLIGPDFYDGMQLNLFTDEDRRRINPFDWHIEFSEIFKSGGFDAVIGNPPYVRQEMLGEFKEYFEKCYKVYHGTADLYAYFIEKGVSLLRQGGLFGIIVANKWMRANYGEPLRKWMKEQRIKWIIDFGDLPVFETATTYPCILLIERETPADSFEATQVKTLKFAGLDGYVNENRYSVNKAMLDDTGWSLADDKTHKLLAKLRSTGIPLGEYVKGNIYRGLLTGLDEAFVISADIKDKLIKEDPRSSELIKLYLMGRDIKRYQLPNSERYLIFTRRGVDISKYPAIERYLAQFKEKLMPKPLKWKGGVWQGRKPGTYQWYEIQDSIDYYKEFEKDKIIYLKFQVNPAFMFDDGGYYPNSATWVISRKDSYLLGILNSKLGWFLISKYCTQIQNGYQLIYKYLQNIPIHTVIASNPTESVLHDRMLELVDQMHTLNMQFVEALAEHDKTLIQRQIEATDNQIDQLVYELYSLTDEEILIVEGKDN